MRNLKKVLSLAMALTMLLGILTISAGAVSFNDYTDKDTIVHVEAVAMLSELGVIKGTDTGAFNPTGAVTRSAMAKMICVALNKGVDNGAAFVGVSASFTDTKGHWAEGYIEYCASLGIIAGDGTGKFNPDASVTGSQASKMLLTALGYDAVKAGLVGAGWELKATVLASSLGFYEDITTLPTAIFNRDDAAQLVYNALFANTVGYSVVTGALVVNDTTFAQERFGLITVKGILLENEYASLQDGATADAGYSVVALNDYASTVTGTDRNKTIKVSSSKDLLGQEISLFVKGSWNDAFTSLTVTKVYGTAVATSKNVVKTTTSTLTADSSAWNSFVGTGYTFATNCLSANYGTVSGAPTSNVVGTKLTLIDNDNDKIYEYAIAETYSFDKVASVSTNSTTGVTTITTSGGLSFSKTAIVGASSIAKGDYINIASIDDLKYVEVPTSVTGVLNSYVADTTLTVGGVAYKISKAPVATITGVTAADDYDSTSNLGASGVFYFDPFGNVIATTAVAVDKNYAVVKAASDASSNMDLNRVQLVATDGTVATYYVNANSSIGARVFGTSTNSTATSLLNTVVTYAIQADGSVKLTAASDAYALADDAVIDAKQTTYGYEEFASFGYTAYANSSTVYIFYGTSTIGVVTGVTNAGAFTIDTDGADDNDVYGTTVIPSTTGTKLIKYVFVGSATSGVSTTAKYAYVTSAAPLVTVESSVYYYTYTVAIGGSLTTLKTTQSSRDTGAYTYTTNTSGVSTLTPVSSPVSGTVSYVDPAGSFIIIGGVVYTMDSSTVVYNVTTAGAGKADTLEADQIVTIAFATDGDIAVAYIRGIAD